MATFPDSSEEIPSSIEAELYDVEEHDEKAEWRMLMHGMITQMMFVSGEEAEPSVQTTTIIEEIVREQVVELVSRARYCRLSALYATCLSQWYARSMRVFVILRLSPLLNQITFRH